MVAFFSSETMRRSLEMLNHISRDGPSAWKIVFMARNVPEGNLTNKGVFDKINEKNGVSVEQMKNA